MTLAKTRSGKRAGQLQSELDDFITLLGARGTRSYLEIGARYGDTFFDVMRSLPQGSKGVCVDLPGSVWGTEGSRDHLKETCQELLELGYRVHMITGNSTDPGIVARVQSHGVFDACLLDGDHRYLGVSADFANYAHLCRMVALHDIVGHGQRHSRGVEVEVPRFWSELEGEKLEFIAPGSKMGIGVWIT